MKKVITIAIASLVVSSALNAVDIQSEENIGSTFITTPTN